MTTGTLRRWAAPLTIVAIITGAIAVTYWTADYDDIAGAGILGA